VERSTSGLLAFRSHGAARPTGGRGCSSPHFSHSSGCGLREAGIFCVRIFAAPEDLPAVERAASPAMSAVSPTEIANKAKAIRRHDCRRGKQDCLLHGFGCGYAVL